MNKKDKPKMSGANWVEFAGILGLVFWMWSELVRCYELRTLVFLVLALSATYIGVCYFAFKISPRAILPIATFLILITPTGYVAYKNSCAALPEGRPPFFTVTFHPTDSLDGVLWLTNDYLRVTNFEHPVRVSGYLGLPVQPQATNTPLIFSVLSSTLAESVQISASFPTNLGIVPEARWERFFDREFTFQANTTNGMQTWGMSFHEPMFPNDGYMLPKLFITNAPLFFPNNDNLFHEVGVRFLLKSKNLPVEVVVFSIILIPIRPEETNARPFVASFADASGRKGPIRIPWR